MRFDGNVYYHELERYPVDVMTDEWRQEAQLMDQAGFTTVWLGEHHFWYDEYAICAAPNPVLVGCFLAENTKRLRVGQSACVLPDWHPLRVAEDIAMVDQMTKGRVDVGVARGTNTTASRNFNTNADRQDQDRNYRLFNESLDIILRAWTEETFSHKGEFYTFPEPGWKQPDPRVIAAHPDDYNADGELVRLGLAPKPYQKPHPPIWQAADSTTSYASAAERGISTIGVSRSIPGIKEAWTRYQDVASAKVGRDLPLGRTASGQTLAIMRLTHVAETQEQAERETRAGINELYSYLSGVNGNWLRKGHLAQNEQLTDEDLNMDWFDFLQKHEVTLVGSPEYVAERIDNLRRSVNCEHFTLWPNPVKIPFRDVMRSFELFAERVMPALGGPTPVATPATAEGSPP